MAIVNRFTEEEKELDRRDTIEMLKKGISQAEIARQLGRSKQYICELKKELIANNLITQEEIDEARKSAIEKRNSKKVNKKDIERKERKTKVLNGLKSGKTAIELMKELNIPSTTINRYIKELIEEGQIDKTEIVNQKNKNKENAETRNEAILEDIKSEKYTNAEIARKYNVSKALIFWIATGRYEEMVKRSSKTVKRKRKSSINNPNLKLSEKENKVLSYLLRGYTYSFITKEMGISQDELLKVINNLKIVNAINSEQIKEARERKIKSDEDEVIDYLKRGFRPRDILVQKREFNVAYLSRMISKLKKEQRITDEEIEQAISQDSDNLEFEELVLNGMKMGLTVKQIIESDETGYATESRVRRMKNYLISIGKISRESFEEEHEKNKQRIKEERYNELDDQIYDLIKKGATPSEISIYLDLTREFVYKRQNKILKDRNISKKQVLEYRNKRKVVFSETRGRAKNENDNDSEKVTSRTAFFELAKEEVKYGNSLQDSDIKMLGMFIIINDKLLTKENLRLVISQYIRLGNYEDINKYINKLIMLYGDTEYGEPLREFNILVKEKITHKIKKNKFLEQLEDR